MKTDPRSCERNFGTIWEKLGEIVNRKETSKRKTWSNDANSRLCRLVLS